MLTNIHISGKGEISDGLYMAHIRPIYGLYTAYIWSIYGLYMAYTRPIAGLYTAYKIWSGYISQIYQIGRKLECVDNWY